MPVSPEGPFCFADVEVDVARREIRRDGGPCTVQPKVFDLLLYLIENRDRAVGKDELQDAVWTGTIVTEAAVNRAIMKARQAVGDDSRRQGVIKTVHRHGYRFVARVSGAGDAGAAAEAWPPVQYVRSGGVHIAYRVLGSGPVDRRHDILIVPGYVFHIEVLMESPEAVAFLRRLSQLGRVILFDKRGIGLSERVGYAPTLEHTAEDILAVLDASGSERAVLFGISEGGPATALFAASHPERLAGLIMYGTMPTGTRSEDFPWALKREQYDAWLAELQGEWGGTAGVEYFAPTRVGDPVFEAWWAKFVRSGSSPASIKAILGVLRDIDVRGILPSIQAPTMVLHRTGDRAILVEAGREVARCIPGAQMVELPGEDHWVFARRSESELAAIEAFIGRLEESPEREAVLATVLVLGGDAEPARDERWGDAVARIEGQHGRIAEVTDTRLVATFQGPTRALECAARLCRGSCSQGTRLHAGVHVGEVVSSGDAIRGSAVDAATALAGLAGPGEVWTTRLVCDLVAGSGLKFSDHDGDRERLAELEPCVLD